MKEEVIKAVHNGRIIAIIRGFAPEVCLNLAEAYARGGIQLVEVTFNQKSSDSWKDTAAAIHAIKTRFGADMRVGAGTVLTEEQLNVLFDYMTQQNQISSIEQVFAEAMARRQELEKQAASIA